MDQARRYGGYNAVYKRSGNSGDPMGPTLIEGKEMFSSAKEGAFQTTPGGQEEKEVP